VIFRNARTASYGLTAFLDRRFLEDVSSVKIGGRNRSGRKSRFARKLLRAPR
jgi:hypothetical protein